MFIITILCDFVLAELFWRPVERVRFCDRSRQYRRHYCRQVISKWHMHAHACAVETHALWRRMRSGDACAVLKHAYWWHACAVYKCCFWCFAVDFAFSPLFSPFLPFSSSLFVAHDCWCACEESCALWNDHVTAELWLNTLTWSCDCWTVTEHLIVETPVQAVYRLSTGCLQAVYSVFAETPVPTVCMFVFCSTGFVFSN